jgi:hypothetical protein
MGHYIVCHKKRNNPRMDIRICEQKCPSKEDCKEFISHRDSSQPTSSQTPVSETTELKAA